METELIETQRGRIAAVYSGEPIIVDGPTALDFLANFIFEHDCQAAAVNKEAIGEDFFRLSTGIAGEVAQKLANYRFRLAVFGDFSGYTSKPLQDYMYECNRGKTLFFVADKAAAIEKLSK